MQKLMGEFSGQISTDLGQYDERYQEFVETADLYDEYREDYEGVVEYR